MADQNKINLDIYKVLIETLTAATDIEFMANNLTQVMVGALDIKGAAIFIINPEREELEVLGSSGLGVDYVNKGPLLVDKSIALGANRETVVVSDAQNSDQLQYPEKAVSEGVRAIVSQPITMRGRLIGALRLYHSEPWEITSEDLDFVKLLSETLGIALMYFRVANAALHVKETINDIHSVWL